MSRDWIYGNEVTSSRLVTGDGAAEVIAVSARKDEVVSEDEWMSCPAIRSRATPLHILRLYLLAVNKIYQVNQ